MFWSRNKKISVYRVTHVWPEYMPIGLLNADEN